MKLKKVKKKRIEERKLQYTCGSRFYYFTRIKLNKKSKELPSVEIEQKIKGLPSVEIRLKSWSTHFERTEENKMESTSKEERRSNIFFLETQLR